MILTYSPKEHWIRSGAASLLRRRLLKVLSLPEVFLLQKRLQPLQRKTWPSRRNSTFTASEVIFSIRDTYRLINDTSSAGGTLSVQDLCRLAGVSRSGYYRWCSIGARNSEEREKKDYEDFRKIKEAYAFRGYSKGCRGISMRLRRMGIVMNPKKIRRLMKKYGLYCPIRKHNPYRELMRILRTDATAPNLVNRQFRSQGARKILLTDITYIPYHGKFAYLSVIKDAYTMQIISYVLSESLEVDFVLETVRKAYREHMIPEGATAILHSDQGSHYTSVAFRRLLEDKGLTQSMSRKGNCWDNAPQESFFGHMKDELKPYSRKWTAFEQVKERIDDWIDYYNNDRYQTPLKSMSPNEYYHYLISGKIPAALVEQKA